MGGDGKPDCGGVKEETGVVEFERKDISGNLNQRFKERNWERRGKEQRKSGRQRIAG